MSLDIAKPRNIIQVFKHDDANLKLEFGETSIGRNFLDHVPLVKVTTNQLPDKCVINEVVALSDGTKVMFIAEDGAVYIYSIADNSIVARLVLGTKIKKYAYHAMGQSVVFATYSQSTLRIHLLELENIRAGFVEKYSLPIRDDSEITHMAVSPTYIATSVTTKEFWKDDRKSVVAVYELGSVRFTKFEMKGRTKTFLFDQRDGLILVLKNAGSYKMFTFLFAPAQDVLKFTLDSTMDNQSNTFIYRSVIPYKSLLVTGRKESYIAVQNRTTPKTMSLTCHYSCDSKGEHIGLDVSSDGQIIVAVTEDQRCLEMFYNFNSIGTIKIAGASDLPLGKANITDVTLTPQSYRVLVSADNGAVYVFDTKIVDVKRVEIIPISTYAINRVRKAALFMYKDHYVYYDTETLQTQNHYWCPAPTSLRLYKPIFDSNRPIIPLVNGFSVMRMEGDHIVTDENGIMQRLADDDILREQRKVLNISYAFPSRDKFLATVDLIKGPFDSANLPEVVRHEDMRKASVAFDAVFGRELSLMGYDIDRNSADQVSKRNIVPMSAAPVPLDDDSTSLTVPLLESPVTDGKAGLEYTVKNTVNMQIENIAT